MIFIQNVGAADIVKGNHFDCGDNSMLIQISDPELKPHHFTTPWFPEPKHKFKEVYKFQFLDVDESDKQLSKYGISDTQAKELVILLQYALAHKMHVVVHCFAGVCRSGAVAEVGEMMGFAGTENFRIPNTMVKTKMLKALGWSYGEYRAIHLGD